MIVHLDLDCFFVSAERTRYEPFRGAAAAVAGRNDTAIFADKPLRHTEFTDAHGVFSGASYYDKFGGCKDWRKVFVENGKVRGLVLAASYEARSHGVKTGVSLSEALRLCPHLRILPSDLPFYISLSNALNDYLERQLPSLEQFGIDEFFADVKGFVREDETERFLRGLQAEIYKEFRLPISFGASSNRSLAKLAAKSAKPFGVRVVHSGEIGAFIEHKPVRAIAGIGSKTANHLARFGVHTLGDILRAPSLLESLGKNGRMLLAELRGENSLGIQNSQERKHIGISRTFDPVLDRAEVKRRLLVLGSHLSFNITKHRKEPTSFVVTVGYSASPPVQKHITAHRLFSEALLRAICSEAFDEIDCAKSDCVNYLSISAGDMHDRRQTNELLEWQRDIKQRKVGEAAGAIRAKYGHSLVHFA